MAGTAKTFSTIGSFTITSFPLYAAAVTPDDNDDLAEPGVVRVGVAGDVTYIPQGGGSAVTLAMVAGEYIPNIVKRVLATGTTATGLTVHY